tara:strand:- start:527 stop:796 length:270 start_codon:yes stop_codon:yes gene_type:complete
MNEVEKSIKVLTDALATGVIALHGYQWVVTATIGLFDSLRADGMDELQPQYVGIYESLTTIHNKLSEQITTNDLLAELVAEVEKEGEEE